LNAATIPSGVAVAVAAAEEGQDATDDEFKDATGDVSAAWEDDADAAVGDDEGIDDKEDVC
jgi:hypothetical protein